MRILITGANGQLGNELRRLLVSGSAEIGSIPLDYENADVVYTDVDDLDITNEEEVLSFMKEGAFDLVINCAAMTNVDGCETKEDIAYTVNAVGPGNLAKAAAATGAKFVQVSTDYVFSGTNPEPRSESDATDPVSAYGRTKLAGEELVAQACDKHFIVRTAWLYGYVGNNFVKTMMRLGADRDQVTVVDDQLGNPTSANDLAYEILKIALTDSYGIYHCTNEGTCSWADFAEAIMSGAGLDCSVARCTSEEYKTMNPASASRPAYSSLRNKHLADTVGNEMRPWKDALTTYFENFSELEG